MGTSTSQRCAAQGRALFHCHFSIEQPVLPAPCWDAFGQPFQEEGRERQRGVGHRSRFSWTAPEGGSFAMAESIFVPMYYSFTYTIPGNGKSGRDGGGDPGSEDNYPGDPNLHRYGKPKIPAWQMKQKRTAADMPVRAMSCLSSQMKNSLWAALWQLWHFNLFICIKSELLSLRAPEFVPEVF